MREQRTESVARRLKHWKLQYATDRLRLEVDQRRHPEDPWFTREAVRVLAQLLRPDDRCFEWGSGRSTRWLATRTASIRSIEHDPEWLARVRTELADQPNACVERVTATLPEYAGTIASESSLDVVIVDGLFRDECALAATDKVRPGGILVIDDVERFLPSSSRAPEAIGHHHGSPRWQEFAEKTAGWRCVWTTNGVTDTALFLRT
jgi:predicted O-methyltransferase YrrM